MHRCAPDLAEFPVQGSESSCDKLQKKHPHWTLAHANSVKPLPGVYRMAEFTVVYVVMKLLKFTLNKHTDMVMHPVWNMLYSIIKFKINCNSSLLYLKHLVQSLL